MQAAVPALILTLLTPSMARAQVGGTAEENLKRSSIQLPAPAAAGGITSGVSGSATFFSCRPPVPFSRRRAGKWARTSHVRTATRPRGRLG